MFTLMAMSTEPNWPSWAMMVTTIIMTTIMRMTIMIMPTPMRARRRPIHSIP